MQPDSDSVTPAPMGKIDVRDHGGAPTQSGYPNLPGSASQDMIELVKPGS